MTLTYYNEDSCETVQSEIKRDIPWGTCQVIEVFGVKTYYTITVASTVRATALAILSMVAAVRF